MSVAQIMDDGPPPAIRIMYDVTPPAIRIMDDGPPPAIRIMHDVTPPAIRIMDDGPPPAIRIMYDARVIVGTCATIRRVASVDSPASEPTTDARTTPDDHRPHTSARNPAAVHRTRTPRDRGAEHGPR